MEQKSRVFALAILFESGLGFAGVGAAWLAGIAIIDRLQLTQSAVERGLIATLPMLVMLVLLTFSTWAPLVEIRKQVEQLVSELFSQSSWLEIALVSLAAGVGEELLFRGALQPWIASTGMDFDKRQLNPRYSVVADGANERGSERKVFLFSLAPSATTDFSDRTDSSDRSYRGI